VALDSIESGCGGEESGLSSKVIGHVALVRSPSSSQYQYYVQRSTYSISPSSTSSVPDGFNIGASVDHGLVWLEEIMMHNSAAASSDMRKNYDQVFIKPHALA
jgi:hypothetical protein